MPSTLGCKEFASYWGPAACHKHGTLHHWLLLHPRVLGAGCHRAGHEPPALAHPGPMQTSVLFVSLLLSPRWTRRPSAHFLLIQPRGMLQLGVVQRAAIPLSAPVGARPQAAGVDVPTCTGHGGGCRWHCSSVGMAPQWVLPLSRLGWQFSSGSATSSEGIGISPLWMKLGGRERTDGDGAALLRRGSD